LNQDGCVQETRAANQQKIAQQLQLATQIEITPYAEFIHFVELKTADTVLDQQQQAVLKQILHYGPQLAEHEPLGQMFISAPRPGTISPWSTQATSIAEHCGLSDIERIERGVLYTLELSHGETVSEQHKTELADVLHDRMTEVCLFQLQEASALFEHHHPTPLSFVHVLEQGRSALEKANSELGLALCARYRLVKDPLRWQYITRCLLSSVAGKINDPYAITAYALALQKSGAKKQASEFYKMIQDSGVIPLSFKQAVRLFLPAYEVLYHRPGKNISCSVFAKNNENLIYTQANQIVLMSLKTGKTLKVS